MKNIFFLFLLIPCFSFSQSEETTLSEAWFRSFDCKLMKATQEGKADTYYIDIEFESDSRERDVTDFGMILILNQVDLDAFIANVEKGISTIDTKKAITI